MCNCLQKTYEAKAYVKASPTMSQQSCWEGEEKQWPWWVLQTKLIPSTEITWNCGRFTMADTLGHHVCKLFYLAGSIEVSRPTLQLLSLLTDFHNISYSREKITAKCLLKVGKAKWSINIHRIKKPLVETKGNFLAMLSSALKQKNKQWALCFWNNDEVN